MSFLFIYKYETSGSWLPWLSAQVLESLWPGEQNQATVCGGHDDLESVTELLAASVFLFV